MTKQVPRISKKFGFGLIFVGLIFLFNPDIAVIDVIPDLFGYLFITLGLKYLRDMCPHIEVAAERFSKMIPIGAAKLFSVAFIFGLTNFDTRPTMILLFAFCFAVVEIIVLVPAWNSLFEGVVYLSQRTVEGVALKTDRFGRDYTTKIKKATIFFIWSKNLFAVLPEFASLSGQAYDDTAFDWSRFIGLFRILAIAAMLVIGISWLIRVLRYFWQVGNDFSFISALTEKYCSEVASKTGLFVRRNIKRALAVATLACLLCMDLFFSLPQYMDVLDILPDFVCGAAFIIVFALLRSFSATKAKRGIVISAVYTVVAAISWILNNRFVHEFTYRRVWKDSDAYGEFFTFGLPLSVIEAILFVCVMFALFAVLRDVMAGHCGYLPDSLSEDYRKGRESAIMHELTKKLIPVGVFAVAVAICSAIAGLMMSLPGFASGEGSNLLIIISEVWWIITLAFSLLLAATFWSFSNAVNDEVDSRYMLD